MLIIGKIKFRKIFFFNLGGLPKRLNWGNTDSLVIIGPQILRMGVSIRTNIVLIIGKRKFWRISFFQSWGSGETINMWKYQ